jgi:uncharacterized protein
MIARFADTSFYVAILNAVDPFHGRAVELSHTFRGRVITTEYVLLELGNWLSRSGDRDVFVGFFRSLDGDTQTAIIPSERTLFRRGFELYAGRQDKDWSLTDCISFVVLEDHNLTEALTTDHHFEQAGFTVLLK